MCYRRRLDLKRKTAWLLATLCITPAAWSETKMVPGKQVAREFVAETVAEEFATSVPYFLFVPQGYGESDARWPLLLFLHGLGESGDGGEELVRVKIHGPPKLVDDRPDFPFIVVSPQCPKPEGGAAVRAAWQPDQLIQLIDHVSGELSIDPDRIYVTGLSMGGFGTWRLVAHHADRFAAAVPICGGGDPAWAPRLTKVPIWCFHGAKDNVVPLARSEEMVDAVRQAGGDARLTVYPEAGHDSWTETYLNQDVYDWLLSHRKGPSSASE